MQPGGAAELETARQEVLQGHDLPGSPWDYSVQDWEVSRPAPLLGLVCWSVLRPPVCSITRQPVPTAPRCSW